MAPPGTDAPLGANEHPGTGVPPGATRPPGADARGASASRDKSVVEGTPVPKTLMNRGCAAVVASTAAPEDVTILRSVFLTRKMPSLTSLVAPGIVLTPDLGPAIRMDVEANHNRPAPMRIGGKKIKRDNDPAHGATYALMDDTMSSISVHSLVSNAGLRRKRATADDDDLVVIRRHHTGRNQVNPHGRKGGKEDDGDGTGSVVRDVRGSRDI